MRDQLPPGRIQDDPGRLFDGRLDGAPPMSDLAQVEALRAKRQELTDELSAAEERLIEHAWGRKP